MKDKSTDIPTAIDPFHAESGFPHSMGTFGTAITSGSSYSGHTDGASIAADTNYYFAVCNGCSFRGDEVTDIRAAQKEAHQHALDNPGHSTFVEEKPAPTS